MKIPLNGNPSADDLDKLYSAVQKILRGNKSETVNKNEKETETLQEVIKKSVASRIQRERERRI